MVLLFQLPEVRAYATTPSWLTICTILLIVSQEGNENFVEPMPIIEAVLFLEEMWNVLYFCSAL